MLFPNIVQLENCEGSKTVEPWKKQEVLTKEKYLKSLKCSAKNKSTNIN